MAGLLAERLSVPDRSAAAAALANVIAGAGWDFTPLAELFTALPGILGGDARAGLDPGAGASPGLLYTCLVVAEVVTVMLICWAFIAGIREWGPARVRGMATRAEADTLLGLGHLRKVAPVVRPDLHRKAPRS